MIYDCFSFFNELELLELRLQELAGVVDKFVLSEATRTHSNKPKPLYYQENRSRFSAFHDKIIHVIVDDLPDAKDSWVLENYQRNSLSRGLVNCRPDDWILVSDVDEIPRASMVQKLSREILYHDNFLVNAVHGALASRFTQKIFHRKGLRRILRKNHPFVWRFEQRLYCYYLNCLSSDVLCGSRMTRFRDFICAEELRHSGYKTVKDAGWHFSYMGGVDRIRQKFDAYAHQEFNQPQFTAPELIAQRINGGQSVLGRAEKLEFVPVDGSFPSFIRQHPEKFSGWLKPL
jgi:beta-1,4-mannosyl-glycoprotein beta-1,4-N-acetylglucosaminyltransferase